MASADTEHDLEKVESIRRETSERPASNMSESELEEKAAAPTSYPLSGEPSNLSREISNDMQRLTGMRLIVVITWYAMNHIRHYKFQKVQY